MLDIEKMGFFFKHHANKPEVVVGKTYLKMEGKSIEVQLTMHLVAFLLTEGVRGLASSYLDDASWFKACTNEIIEKIEASVTEEQIQNGSINFRGQKVKYSRLSAGDELNYTLAMEGIMAIFQWNPVEVDVTSPILTLTNRVVESDGSIDGMPKLTFKAPVSYAYGTKTTFGDDEEGKVYKISTTFYLRDVARKAFEALPKEYRIAPRSELTVSLTQEQLVNYLKLNNYIKEIEVINIIHPSDNEINLDC